MKRDEEHSAWQVAYRDATNAERVIGVELAHCSRSTRSCALLPSRLLVTISLRSRWSTMAIAKCSQTGAIFWRTSKPKACATLQVQRYKGLGEMNAEQLWETTMNPEKRTLLQVRLEDLVECEEIFSTLMGEDVESRRKFIEDNALDVRNLDV